MSEQKKKIGFTVVCVSEFAKQHNYDGEHTLDLGTILEDLGVLCRKNGGML